MAQGWLEAPASNVASPGEARDELGAPKVVTGAEGAEAMGRLGYNVENMTSMLPIMNQITQSTTSLVDNAYNRNLQYKQALLNLDESQEKLKYTDQQIADMQQQSDQNKQLFPLKLKAADQDNKLNQVKIDEANRQLDDLNKATAELPAYRDEMNKLDYNDPALDDKIAAIKAKYPNASTYPQTEQRVAGIEQDLYSRRKNSTTFQYNSALMGGLEQLQQKGLLPSNTDVRKEVLAGNGDALLVQANREITNKRLDAIGGVANAVDQPMINALRSSINNPAPEQGPVFGHDGSLNAEDDARISQLERKYNITPQYPGAKMTITRKVNKDTGQAETDYEITGMPPTEADIATAEGRGAGAGAGGQPHDWANDQFFKQALSQINADPSKANLPRDKKVDAIMDLTRQLYDQNNVPWPGTTQQGQTQTNENAPTYAKPKPGETPTLPVQPTGASGQRVPRNRRGMPLSEADTGAGLTPVSYQEGAARVATSNGAYQPPAEAGDVLGINRNVWGNVMSEEGPEFGKDGSHDSVFGLWADSNDVEGEAYNVARRYGANSPEAFQAVTAAWTDKFLKQSQPWQLTSPGLQEMVIADSQHVGGAAARKIIDEMGGYAAVNNMNPGEAIDEYARLRAGLWPGNMGRVIRERNWALKNDGILRGQPGSGQQMTASASPAAPGQQPAAPATAAATRPAAALAQAPAARPTPFEFRPATIAAPTEREGEVAQYLPRAGATA
jgi:hypothetical protein